MNLSVTRGHLLLAFGILAGGVGLAVVVAPEIIPPEFEQFSDLLDEQTVSRFAIGLGVFVVLVAVFRLLRASPEQVDRSPIARIPPELVTASEAENADRQARQAYHRALGQFESPNHSTRLVAIYGRRAREATQLEGEIERYLKDLATTAAETYAMAVGCDEATAERAVETGRWTDDRVAAAFLATDIDSEVSFTSWERFNAWLTPERAFEARVRRVLEEVEYHADSYLTYGGMTEGTGRPPERTDVTVEQTARTGRADAGNRHARADGGARSRPDRDDQQSTEGDHGE